MSTYFVYRCDEMDVPNALHRRRRFPEDATVIDWFRNHWRPIEDTDEAAAHAREVLGTDVYSFYDVFRAAAAGPAPTTIEEVRDVLEWCYNSEIRYEDHCVQVLTDDDDTDMAFYFFDDDFVAAHPELTAYLLHDGPLPDGAGPPGWLPNPVIKVLSLHPPMFHAGGEGRLYVVPEMRDDSALYEDLADVENVDVVEGLRLPDFCRTLMNLPAGKADEYAGYKFASILKVLLAADLAEDDPHESAFVQTLQATPADEATWRAYADWLMERDGPSPGARLLRLALPRVKGLYGGDPARNVVHVGEHVAHVCINTGSHGFDQLILFDDLWRAAHPLLADAILRHGSRWDVLSTGDERSTA